MKKLIFFLALIGFSITALAQKSVSGQVLKNNVMNSLSGKVSGLQITQSNTGVDGSSRILLRGITTINGANRPLVVVDGIPISNGSGGCRTERRCRSRQCIIGYQS